MLLRSVAGSGAVRIAAMAASFAVGVQLARGLGVSGYGYYGLALAILETVGIPCEMGIPKLVTREVAAANARGESGYVFGVLRWGRRLALRISVAVALAVLVSAVVLQSRYRSDLTLALAAGAPVIPFVALVRVEGGALQGLHHIVRGQIPVSLLNRLIMSTSLLGVYIIGLTLRPWSAMVLYTVAGIGAWLVARIWLKQRLPRRTNREEIREGRRWIASIIPMALSDSMFTLQGQISVLLLGAFATAADVGLFRISVATAVMVAAPQAIMVAVTVPFISRLHEQQDRTRLQMLLTRAAQAQFGGTLLLSLPLVLAAEPILRLVYGQAFAAAGNALRIILVGQLVSACFGLNATLLNMTRHERRVTRAVAIALLLNGIGIAVLVPIFGLVGGAVGYVASTIAWNVITWRDVRRLVGVDTSFLALRTSQP